MDGVKKERMVLTCLEKIKAFVRSSGQGPGERRIEQIESAKWAMACTVEYSAASKRGGNGPWVDRPILEIKEAGSGGSIPFGLLKAEAILQLEDEIEGFAGD